MDIFTTHSPPSSKQASADIERSRTFPSVRSFTAYLVKTFKILNNINGWVHQIITYVHWQLILLYIQTITHQYAMPFMTGWQFFKSSLWNQLWQKINTNYMPLPYACIKICIQLPDFKNATQTHNVFFSWFKSTKVMLAIHLLDMHLHLLIRIINVYSNFKSPVQQGYINTASNVCTSWWYWTESIISDFVKRLLNI